MSASTALRIRAAAEVPPQPSLAAKVAALRDPANYPECPLRVQAIETHYAWVFLTGARAYKLKKPLQMRGADLRSLDAREKNCGEELRLNRRLAPTTYLRVLPLTRSGSRLTPGGKGQVVDWLVEMRELDRTGMLDQRLAQGRTGGDELSRLVATLAHFYRRVVPEAIHPQDYVDSVRARIAESLTELARAEFGLPGRTVSELGRDLLAACEANAVALAARAASGRVIESHGDLRAEHVWLGCPLQIIDTLEFDRRLRVLDTAEEVAMLAIDMASLGFRHAASDLEERYRRVLPDAVPVSLLAFYEALRAATRAKVAIWHLEDPQQFPDPAPWRRSALEFIALARQSAALAE
jgi:aminoglycoside phosphotransferase family enzyme